jgi:hypothetical protein
MQTANSEPVQISDQIVLIAIDKMKKAKTKTVLVRKYGAKYRLLDNNINPLINLTGSQLRVLTDNGILHYVDDNNYKYNPTVKIAS